MVTMDDGFPALQRSWGAVGASDQAYSMSATNCKV